MLDLGLLIVKKEAESLDQVIVSDFFSECLSKLSEVPCKAQAYLPGLVFTSGEECSQGMDLVLLFGEMASHWDQGL